MKSWILMLLCGLVWLGAADDAPAPARPLAQMMARPVVPQMHPGGINTITDPRVYWSLVSNPELTVLVVFTTASCPTCKMQYPFLVQFGLERPDVLILEVDAQAMSDLTWRHQVRQVPTNVVWRGGVVTQAVSKGLTTSALQNLVGPPVETTEKR